jgi:hypothetical protein
MRELDINQGLSSPPFSDMIQDMVILSLLEVGQKLGADIVSHWQLEMVQENHG